MKKTFLFGALALGFSLLASPRAQAQSLRFGLKGGGNLSNFSGNLTNQDQYKNRFGFHAGAILNIGLVDDDFFSIQPEILYSQKGVAFQGNNFTLLGNTISRTGNLRYDYLDVPVLLRIKTSGVFFEAGPQYSRLLNVTDNRTTTRNGQTFSESSQVQNLDNVQRNEWGYAAGLGYQSEAGPMIGLRYNGAFTDFARNADYNNNEFANARNSVFQLYLGFMLGGNK